MTTLSSQQSTAVRPLEIAIGDDRRVRWVAEPGGTVLELCGPGPDAVWRTPPGMLQWPYSVSGSPSRRTKGGSWEWSFPILIDDEPGGDLTQGPGSGRPLDEVLHPDVETPVGTGAGKAGTLRILGRADSGHVRLVIEVDAGHLMRRVFPPALRWVLATDGERDEPRTYRSGQQSVFFADGGFLGVNTEAGTDIARVPVLSRIGELVVVDTAGGAVVPPSVVPNHYLARLSGRAHEAVESPAQRHVVRLWWGTGDELASLATDMVVSVWGSHVRRGAARPNPHLTWAAVRDLMPLAWEQLQSFPSVAPHGRSVGVAPYHHGVFSDMSQWFYQPQIYWPFVLAAPEPARDGLVDELLNILDTYSRDTAAFRPVNTVLHRPADHEPPPEASVFHWGWAFHALFDLWRLTGHSGIGRRVTELLDAFLPAMPEDHLARTLNPDTFSFNEQARWGANGTWALGLLVAHEHTGDERYALRALALVEGASRQLKRWERLGGIEDWEGFKPDGVGVLARASHELSSLFPATINRAVTERFARLALMWMQTSDLADGFPNAYPPVGPAVQNIAWCRAGSYPDSDARCEATLELLATVHGVLASFDSLGDKLQRIVLEYLAVLERTLLSFCTAGATGGLGAPLSLIALELHDNNTDILTVDRQPLVASYMTGHPLAFAHLFRESAEDEIVLDRAVSGLRSVLRYSCATRQWETSRA